MLDLLLIVVFLDVLLILAVPEGIWLTIHRNVRKWVKAGIDKIKSLSS